MPLRVLTFNWHESYIHMMAKTGHHFEVVEREKAGIRGWIRAIRPVPTNCRLISEEEGREGLGAGKYDRIVAHNLQDLLSVRDAETPKILVFHNKLSTEIALNTAPVDRNEYLGQVAVLFEKMRNLTLVFISPGKMRDWGFHGEVILPGIDPEDYHGYSGEEASILRVGNGLKERDIMLGHSVQERVTRGLPSTILGLNAALPQATIPGDWDAYRGFLRRHRTYLNTTLEPYEDGYNLAMLEAMATGMPVVSIANRTSPIEDGGNGYLGQDETELRARLETLLQDRPLATRIGRRSRECALDRFPMGRFIERWNAVLEAATHPEEREAIAAAGRREVLAGHTYRHRAEKILDAIQGLEAKGGRRRGGVQRTASRDLVATGPEDAGRDTTQVRLPDYYKQERAELEALIPEGSKRILDIGCGGGHLGRLLKGRADLRAGEIWGVEIQPDACEEAKRWLDRVFQADAREWVPPVDRGTFDVLVFADVLEHLRDPKAVLERYLNWLKPCGSVVMSIPNVRFWGVVQHLAEGHWTYQDEGLLDRDHVRFFTWSEIERLLASCGLEVAEFRANVDRRCPELPEEGTTDLRLGRITVHDLGPEDLREFFVFQYLVRGVRRRDLLYAEADRLEAGGNRSEAFRLCEALLLRNGADPSVTGKLVELAATAEQKERASAVIDRCLSTHPANVDLLLASSRLLAERERFDEAKQRLERVLLFLPEHEEAKAGLHRLSCR